MKTILLPKASWVLVERLWLGSSKQVLKKIRTSKTIALEGLLTLSSDVHRSNIIIS